MPIHEEHTENNEPILNAPSRHYTHYTLLLLLLIKLIEVITTQTETEHKHTPININNNNNNNTNHINEENRIKQGDQIEMVRQRRREFYIEKKT